MSIPKYQERQLTLQRLSDDIMKTALERAEFIAMDINVARNVCYMWLSLSAVWDEELEAFEKALCSEKEVDFESSLDAVEYLSNYVEEALAEKDAAEYRKLLDRSAVKVAMRKAGLGNTISDDDVSNMLVLLSMYAVGAKEHELCEAYKLPITAVTKTAILYDQDEGERK